MSLHLSLQVGLDVDELIDLNGQIKGLDEDSPLRRGTEMFVVDTVCDGCLAKGLCTRSEEPSLGASDKPILRPATGNKSRGLSKYLGVSRKTDTAEGEMRWQAHCYCSKTKRRFHLGTFHSEEEAGSAFARARREQEVAGVGEDSDADEDKENEDEDGDEDGEEAMDEPILRPATGSRSRGSSRYLSVSRGQGTGDVEVANEDERGERDGDTIEMPSQCIVLAKDNQTSAQIAAEVALH